MNLIRRALPVALALIAIGAISFYLNPLGFVDRSLDLQLWRSGVRSHYAHVDGYRIHYLEAKPKNGQDGPPLVLVHGLGAKASDWVAMIPALTDAGFHVYAPDLLGYGRSERPVNASYSISEEEDIVRGFMESQHIQQADIAGWSMGGWVVMKLALDHPEKVRRLAIYDSAGIYFPIDFDLNIFSPRDTAGLERLTEIIEPNQRHIQFPDFAAPGMLRRFRENEWIVSRTFQSMISGRELLDFRLDALKQPMLIVWGAEDKLTPIAVGERIHAMVPQSVFVELEGCGHLAPAECSHQTLRPTIPFFHAPAPPPPSETTVPAQPFSYISALQR